MISIRWSDFAIVAGLSGAFFVASGCSNGRAANQKETVPVSGIVVFDGKPLTNADVLFHPVGHVDAARGHTDASGRYELVSYVDVKGAVPGQFKVTLHKKEPDEGIINMSSDPQPARPERKHLIPEKYASPDSSGFEVTVLGGQENKFNFELVGQ